MSAPNSPRATVVATAFVAGYLSISFMVLGGDLPARANDSVPAVCAGEACTMQLANISRALLRSIDCAYSLTCAEFSVG